MISRLHKRRKVTNSDLLQRRLAPSRRHANIRQALSQGAGSSEQDIAVDLHVRRGERQSMERKRLGGL